VSQRTRFNYIRGQAPEETIEIIMGFRPSPASNAYIMKTAISYSGITGLSGRGSLGSIGTNKGTYNDMKVRFENLKVEYERKVSLWLVTLMPTTGIWAPPILRLERDVSEAV
jgi:hypothetical protein